MRKKLMLLGAIFLWQSFFMNAGRLDDLHTMYGIVGSTPETWSWAYDRTHQAACSIVNEANYEPQGYDLSVLWAFLRFRDSLICFIDSTYFDRENHIPWLINLFLIAGKVARSFEECYEYIDEYEAIVYSLDKDNFVTTIKNNNNFQRLCKIVENILGEEIDREEED